MTLAVADLESEVSARCGLLLDAAGLFARAADGSIPVIRQGLRIGAKAVGLALASPLVLADSDLAALSSFGAERVMDEAEWHALKLALAGWWRASQAHQEAVSSVAVVSGWARDQKAAVVTRVGQLDAICKVPYREPVGDVVVMNGPFREVSPTGEPGQPPAYPGGFGYPYGFGQGPFGGPWSW